MIASTLAAFPRQASSTWMLQEIQSSVNLRPRECTLNNRGAFLADNFAADNFAASTDRRPSLKAPPVEASREEVPVAILCNPSSP